MDWIIDVLKTTGTLGFTGAVAGIAIALTSKFIDHRFTSQRETSNLELQHKLTEALEATRNALSSKSLIQEIRFRRTFEKQADVLAETYARLLTLNKAIAKLVSMYQPEAVPIKELAERARVASIEFNEYYYAKAIFLPERLHERIAKMADMLVDIGNNFIQHERNEQHRVFNENGMGFWLEAFNKVELDVPPLLKDLRQEFQRLLGSGDDQ